MCQWLRPFIAGMYAFSKTRNSSRGTGSKIADYELKIWDLFLKSPRFPTPRSFLRGRLKIEIYTDACDRTPFGKESITWESWIGIGVDSSHKRYSLRISLARSKRKIPTWLKGLSSPRRLISFFELLGKYRGQTMDAKPPQ